MVGASTPLRVATIGLRLADRVIPHGPGSLIYRLYLWDIGFARVAAGGSSKKEANSCFSRAQPRPRSPSEHRISGPWFQLLGEPVVHEHAGRRLPASGVGVGWPDVVSASISTIAARPREIQRVPRRPGPRRVRLRQPCRARAWVTRLGELGVETGHRGRAYGSGLSLPRSRRHPR